MAFKRLPYLIALASLVAGLTAVVSTPAAAETSANEPQPCTATFASGPVNRPIEHIVGHGMTSDLINVPAMQAPLADLDVTMTIEHPQIVNLVVTLGRNGVGVIDLARHRGTVEGENFTGTVLDDEAALSLYDAQAPFTGPHRPDSPLSVADGTDPQGEWSLRVQDTGASDQPYGTLVSWSLTMTFAWCDTDGDGLRDPADRCPRLAATTSTGCPAVARTVTVKHDSKAFYGRLYAPDAPTCHAHRPLTIWRVYAGQHRRIGSLKTLVGGRYRLAKPRRAGRYYIVAPRVVVDNLADCNRARSALK